MLSRLVRFFSSATDHTSVCTNIFDEIEAVLDGYAAFEKSIVNSPNKVQKQIAYLEKIYNRLQPFAHKQNLQELGLKENLLDDLPSAYLDDITYELLDIVVHISGPHCTTPYTIGLSSLIGLISAAKTNNRPIQDPVHRGVVDSISIDREKTLEINEFSRLLATRYSKEKTITSELLQLEITRFKKSLWREMLESKFYKKRHEQWLKQLIDSRNALVKRIENPNEEKYPQLIAELESIDSEIEKFKPINLMNAAELKRKLNQLMIAQESLPDDKGIAREIANAVTTLENRLGLFLLVDEKADKPKDVSFYLPAP
ncbi:MAG: hypothetical protein WAW86_06125 [Gammaproteobacteria bacterium]